MPMRVLVADPVTIFRTGVRNLLRRESDFEVVEASSYEEAELRLDGSPVRTSTYCVGPFSKLKLPLT